MCLYKLSCFIWLFLLKEQLKNSETLHTGWASLSGTLRTWPVLDKGIGQTKGCLGGAPAPLLHSATFVPLAVAAWNLHSHDLQKLFRHRSWWAPAPWLWVLVLHCPRRLVSRLDFQQPLLLGLCQQDHRGSNRREFFCSLILYISVTYLLMILGCLCSFLWSNLIYPIFSACVPFVPFPMISRN